MLTSWLTIRSAKTGPNKDDLSLHPVPNMRSIKALTGQGAWWHSILRPFLFARVLPHLSSINLSVLLTHCPYLLLSGCETRNSEATDLGAFDDCRLFGTLTPQIKLHQESRKA